MSMCPRVFRRSRRRLRHHSAFRRLRFMRAETKRGMLFGSRDDGNGHRRPSGRVRHVLGQCLGPASGDILQTPSPRSAPSFLPRNPAPDFRFGRRRILGWHGRVPVNPRPRPADQDRGSLRCCGRTGSVRRPVHRSDPPARPQNCDLGRCRDQSHAAWRHRQYRISPKTLLRGRWRPRFPVASRSFSASIPAMLALRLRVAL